MAMNSKQPVTVFVSSGDSRNASGKDQISKKPISASLSDFLHQKLHKTSAQLGIVEGKSTPFLSPLGSSGVFADGNIAKKQIEGETTGTVSDKVALDQFRHLDQGNGNFAGSHGVVEEENSNTDDLVIGELIGVGNLFQGKNTIVNFTQQAFVSFKFNAACVEEESNTRGNQVVVLGGNSQLRQKRADVKFLGRDSFKNGGKESNSSRRNIDVVRSLSQLKRKRRKEGFFGSTKPKSYYNHYENGSGGWWDSDMEGVDSKEVGFNEVWEGVGSTTLGGIEWH